LFEAFGDVFVACDDFGDAAHEVIGQVRTLTDAP
jgi:hypothetical protein